MIVVCVIFLDPRVGVIDGRYWEQEEETHRERGSGQSSEKKTDKLQSQPSSLNQGNQNKHHKKLFVPRDSSLSSQNSKKKKSDLDDKIGKDSKLTAMERARHFPNNLCLFCGGVRHTAKECPKSSSSATKAKGHAAKGKFEKPESPPAEDSKK